MTSDRIKRRLEQLLDEADQAVAQSKWDVARDRAQNVLAFDPDNADAKAYLAAADRALATAPTPASPVPVGVQGLAPLPPVPSTAPAAPKPAPTPAHPASFAGGRYTVKRFLGEGGKKKVYLAHDNTLDRDVAFALIKTAGLDEVAKVRITREAQAMGRLGSHPNIVTVFELGSVHPPEGEEGQPYIVTELMGGGDVEGLIEKAPEHKMPLERALKIATETCRGLEFAHARNIIHRDLKPGNVWLTADGPSAGSGQAVAKIGDFGLAVAIDRSRLTSEGMMVGTVSYMPPEQAMGGEVTPRSDLYSLGAMLYEMVTGRPPFLGDSPVAIIGQHINTPPVAPTWHNAQCPRALEALIMRLLAKDPKERPASAADVRRALEAVDLRRGEVSSPNPQEKTNVLDSVAGGVFVGRQREMSDLRAALEDTLGGKGRMVALVGEPGIGKTRTSLELATYAGLRQAQVLWGRCYEAQGVPPYWPWVQAIRSYVREKPAQQVRTEMGSGAADIAEVVSDVKDRLPDLPKPAPMDPEQARFRLFDSITAFLKSASKAQPILLILDDLHWADRPSLLLLEFVAREIGTSRVLLVGTYRDVEVSRRSPLAQTLGELTRERLYQRVLLRGLSKEDVGKFVEQAAGVQPPVGLVDAVYTQTEGNPFFVTEVVRLLTQEGVLSVRPEPVEGRASTGSAGARASTSSARTGNTQTGEWAVRIPEGVREVIGRRLDRLSERCNGVLTIAAVVGREFSLQQLEALTRDAPEAEERLSGDRLLEVVEEALSARVIEELPRAVGRYQFTHALIQETLAGELSTTRKVRLHARIAEALEKLYGKDAEAHAPELAYHFAEAQTLVGPGKLVKYSLLAGEKALASYAWEEAAAHFTRVLEAKGVPLMGEEPARDAEAAQALSGLGRALIPQSGAHQPEAWRHLGRAFEYFITSGDMRGLFLATNHSIPAALRLPGMSSRSARALERFGPDSLEAGWLSSRLGFDLGIADGDYKAAQPLLQKAVALARRYGDDGLYVTVLERTAAVAAQHLRVQEAMAAGRAAFEVIARKPDAHTSATATAWYTLSALALGQPAEAMGAARLSLSILERYRSPVLQESGSFHIARVALSTGDYAAAREAMQQQAGGTGVPTSAFSYGTGLFLCCSLGEMQEAEAWGERMAAVHGEAPANLTAWVQFSYIAALCLADGLPSRYIPWVQKTAAAAFAYPSLLPLETFRAQAILGLLAIANRDAAAALPCYAAILPQRGYFHSHHSNDRVLGLLAHTMGNHDTAAQHFEEAVAFCRKAGYRPELARALCDYADLLRERNATGDRQHAARLLDESLRIASELGMKPLMARVLARKEVLKA